MDGLTNKFIFNFVMIKILESFTIQTSKQMRRRLINNRLTKEVFKTMQKPIEQIRDDLKNSHDNHLIALEKDISDNELLTLIAAVKDGTIDALRAS